MAEVALKVRDGANYEDKDCLCAFNDRSIACVHANMITSVVKAGFNRDGLRELGTVFEDWYALTCQFKFTRLTRTTFEKKDLILDTTDERGPADGDIGLYLQRRILHPRHKIFGTTGAEIWYGGNVDTSLAVVNQVWTAIETKTAFRQVDHTRWPAGIQDLRSHLILPVTNFDDTTSRRIVSSVMDNTDPENPVMVRKRSRFIDWRALSLGRTEAEVEDRDVSIDVRDIPDLDHTVVVEVKP